MRRLGILGRADWQGGISQQSFAVAKHLEPYVSAALVLDMSPGDRGRGPFDPQPWFDLLGGRAQVAAFPFSDAALDWLVWESDVIFAVEGPPPGRDEFPELCAANGVELVIHANPELWRESYRGATTRVCLPTSWHQERFPDAPVLPMPVDRERFPFRARTHAETFLHVAAPAFHDRAGTALLLQALGLVTERCRVIMHGVRDMNACVEDVGPVRVIYRPPVPDNRDVYSDAADVLVVPRRYGGLALYAQEGASLGMPLVTLDLPPLNAMPNVVTVPLTDSYTAGMIGGDETVWATEPLNIARTIDQLVRSPADVAFHSKEADRWAREHSWEALRPAWVEALGL